MSFKPKPLAASVRSVLQKINEGIPKGWLKQLVKKQWASPALREMVDRGLKDKEVSEETKKKLLILKNSEEYSDEVEVVDPKIEQKIDNYLSREVKKAIQSGALPPLTKEDFYVKSAKTVQPAGSGEIAIG